MRTVEQNNNSIINLFIKLESGQFIEKCNITEIRN